MSRVQFLRSKRNVIQAVVHRFILKYRDGCNDIYLFFEGKDDPSFYLPEIRKRASTFGTAHTFQCEGKGTLLAVHGKVVNHIDNKHRCLFFIDKDLDNYLGIRNPRHMNIFVTEPYSIENYICGVESLHILWTELLHLPESDPRLQIMLTNFNFSYSTYAQSVRPIMAWVLNHRENYPNDRNKLNLNNLTIAQLLDMDPITFKVRRKTGTYQCIVNATNMQENPVPINKIKEKTKLFDLSTPKNWGRGKFEAGWFAAFIEKTISRFQQTRSANELKLSLRLQVNAQNIVDVFAGRITCPQPLAAFLDFNFSKI